MLEKTQHTTRLKFHCQFPQTPRWGLTLSVPTVPPSHLLSSQKGLGTLEPDLRSLYSQTQVSAWLGLLSSFDNIIESEKTARAPLFLMI